MKHYPTPGLTDDPVKALSAGSSCVSLHWKLRFDRPAKNGAEDDRDVFLSRTSD